MLGFGKKKKKNANELLGNYDIPIFPTTVLSILSKLRDPDVSINELAASLEVDPGLHVRVLKTVNSVAFGLSHKVNNIGHAVNLLGRGRLESLVLSVAVKDGVTKNNQAQWLDMTNFWATAARRATIARGLANILHPKVQSDVFTIGLLQDMAVPVMASTNGDRYRDIYQIWLADIDGNLTEQEQAQLSTNHAKLGAQMAEYWEFPQPLVDAIAAHHSPTADTPLSIKIAALIKGCPESDNGAAIVERAQQIFGIDTTITAETVDEILAESGALTNALS
ncbi:MAG: HDOD domain-containing protein [Thermodesulfobacteriota bacterium]|nr:HDOD domain-containing protein [Thermodesulfobacteriota bacterium]